MKEEVEKASKLKRFSVAESVDSKTVETIN